MLCIESICYTVSTRVNGRLLRIFDLEGVKSIERKKLEDAIESEKGEVYQKQLVDDDVRRIGELYRDNEYRTVVVRPRQIYNEVSRGVLLSYEIIEGKKIRIEFVGDGIDRSELEQRAAAVHTGDHSG